MSNNTSSPVSSLVCPPFNPEIINTVVSYLLFFVFSFSLLLNGGAAWVSLHLQSTSTFIVYLKNLVAADLLMTLMLPPMAASQLPGASEGLLVFTCRFTDVIFYSCLYTSIVLMGLISLDRFFKIVRPRGMVLGQHVMFSKVTSTLVWVVLFGGTAVPTMILTNQHPANVTEDFCMSLKSPAGVHFHNYVIIIMEILFWLVSILMVFCYVCITMKVLQSFKNSGSNNSEGKKKTKLRVFLVLLVFCVCFVPLHVMRIPFTVYETFDIDVCATAGIEVAHRLAIWVSTTNSCMDPFLYIYLCREFRDKLVEMMKARGFCVGLSSGEREKISP